MRHPMENKSFVEWLERQPPEKEFDYDNGNTCAICQYFQAVGIDFKVVQPAHWQDHQGTFHKLPVGWNDAARANRCQARQTFGEAAKKARATLLV